MSVGRQYIISKGLLQISISFKIIHRIKAGAVVPVFKGSVSKIMLNISIPVVPKSILEIRVHLSVLNYIDHLVHYPAL